VHCRKITIVGAGSKPALAGVLNVEFVFIYLMTIFRVKAATPTGGIVYKEFEAPSREGLDIRLERDGLYPLEVGVKGGILSRLASLKTIGRVGYEDFYVFNKGLITMLKAGVPVLDCIETLKNNSRNETLRRALEDLVKGIRDGKSVSEAMKDRTDVFPALYAAVISAGERTGDLIPAIRGYIEYQKRIEGIRKKITAAAMYPSMLAFASFAVVCFLVTYVVPSFAGIYLNSGTRLPLPTHILMILSGFVRNNIFLIMAGAAASIAGLFFLITSSSSRRRIDALKLSLPRIGEIYRGYAVSKFSRTLGMVIKSGVPLIHALEMCKAVFNNSVLEDRLGKVIKKVSEGSTVSAAISEEGLMSEITMRMFTVGESSASLPVVLDDIADFQDEALDHSVSILTSLIEPALMVVMGLIIGAIVILMYLPIFQLGARI